MCDNTEEIDGYFPDPLPLLDEDINKPEDEDEEEDEVVH